MIERLQLLSLLHAMCCNAGQKVSTTITNPPVSKFLEKKKSSPYQNRSGSLPLADFISPHDAMQMRLTKFLPQLTSQTHSKRSD